jgi:ketosteroid isomerase-like protein
MNEQQNTALIQKMYDDFGRGDIPAILAALADDVEWTLEAPSIIPFAGKRKGPAEVLGFFQALGTTQKNQKLTKEQRVAQGDIVATSGRYSGTVTRPVRASTVKSRTSSLSTKAR